MTARVPIPHDTAAEIMFISDRTCCVCNERGKPVQIHHIDENPGNNVIENLSVLCLECHNDTQIRGGFGRKLNSPLVIRYREEWIARVKKRREDADALAISKTAPEPVLSPQIPKVETKPHSEIKDHQMIAFIKSLPSLRRDLENQAQPELDTGVTSRMVEASYKYIDSMQGILVALAEFYAKGTFGDNIQDFFSEQISLRFAWHRSHIEPHGPGTGGTIVNIMICGSVRDDAEKMVEDMVMSLAGLGDILNWQDWQAQWRGTQKWASDGHREEQYA